MLLTHILNNNLVDISTVNRVMHQSAQYLHPNYIELTRNHQYRFRSVNWLTDFLIVEVFLEELRVLNLDWTQKDPNYYGISEFILLKHVLAHYLRTRHHCVIPKYFTDSLLENEYRMLDHQARERYLKINSTLLAKVDKMIEQCFPETIQLFNIGLNHSSVETRNIILTGNVDVKEQLRIPMGFTIDPVVQTITFIY